MSDFTGCLVREGECADPGGIALQLLDQEPNAFDQTVRFAGAGTGEHEQWSGRRLDRVALRARGTPVGE
jgi:hypothetical protein